MSLRPLEEKDPEEEGVYKVFCSRHLFFSEWKGGEWSPAFKARQRGCFYAPVQPSPLQWYTLQEKKPEYLSTILIEAKRWRKKRFEIFMPLVPADFEGIVRWSYLDLKNTEEKVNG